MLVRRMNAAAFEVVKRYLTEPPILSSPKSDEQLYMYLVVSDYVNGADGPSLKECRLKLPILPGSSSDCTYKSATPSYPAQTRSIRMNAKMVIEFNEYGIKSNPTITNRKLIEQAIHLSFSASNNETEYEVVLAEQDLALVLEGTKLEIRSDSQLIVDKFNESMKQMMNAASHLKKLDYWVIRRVPREENEKQMH
ncbi:hypothetical protein CK203_111594 [Vitis vinifera]|uniref:RNase H type-1 domain-containing protein n=1 Tax=Vitis vinifera TaxID=29760 RepID=A0A438FD37_VITVI|nr:hypothetical protein CK203_111594 [Vitis vinifera]